MEAILNIAEGDMRQAINILQSCHMYASGIQQKLNVKDIYNMAGRAPPSDTEACFKTCIQETKSLDKVWEAIENYMQVFGASLLDVIGDFYKILTVENDNLGDWYERWQDLGFTDETQVLIMIEELDRMQQRLMNLTDPTRVRIQAYALASMFTRSQHMM